VKAEFERHPGIGLVFGRIKPFGICPPEQLEHERRFFAAAARNAAHCSRFGRFGRKLAFTGRILFGPAMLVCSAGAVRCVGIVKLYIGAPITTTSAAKTDKRTTALEHHVMVRERQTRCKLTETGTAVLECTTSISRRSFMEIANARRRPKAAVGQPAAATAGFHPKRR
jgi:hypothetical protein